jgi:hypothetical protein
MFARLEGLAKSIPLAIPALGVALLVGVFCTPREVAAQGALPAIDIPADPTPAAERPRPRYRYDEPDPAVPPKPADRDSFPLKEPATDTPAELPKESPPGGGFGPTVPAIPPSTLAPSEAPLFAPARPSDVPSAADAEYKDLIDKHAAPAEEGPAVAEAPRSLGDLQLALRDVLRERETELRSEYIAGTASLTELLAATDEVFQVELALVGTKEERIDLLNTYLDSLARFEAKAEPLVRAGSLRVTPADYAAFKAVRLRAQIALAQEQGGTLGGAANSPANDQIGAARNDFRVRKAQYDAGTVDGGSLAKAGMTLCRLLADKAEAAGDLGQALQYINDACVFASRNHEAVQTAYIAAQVPVSLVDEAETQLADCIQKFEQLQRSAGQSPAGRTSALPR